MRELGHNAPARKRRRRGTGSLRFDAKRGLYIAQITINGKRKSIARKTEAACVRALDEAAAEMRKAVA